MEEDRRERRVRLGYPAARIAAAASKAARHPIEVIVLVFVLATFAYFYIVHAITHSLLFSSLSDVVTLSAQRAGTASPGEVLAAARRPVFVRRAGDTWRPLLEVEQDGALDDIHAFFDHAQTQYLEWVVVTDGPAGTEAARALRAQLERALRARRALRLQAHRALSIASYAPKFDQQGFDPKRATDPDAERAQNAKLRALLKKERKGAIRELRKDAQFVAEAREQRRAEEDAAYKRKIDKITHGLQEERSEEKQLDRAKATLRKRAGKRAT